MKENITDNEKKEILEIAEEIAFSIVGDVADNEDASSVAPIAEALYEAGYRKQSETVKEFAEKIKASPNRDYSHSYQLGLLGLTENDINNLAEQYGKEECNETD